MVYRLTAGESSLFDEVAPGVRRRARFIRWWPMPPGTSGMTLGRFILLRRGIDIDARPALVVHELVHVEQYREVGAVAFLARYVTDYLRGLASERSHQRAYLAIPAEREARARVRRWQNRH